MPSGPPSSLGGPCTQLARYAPVIPPDIVPRRSCVAYFLTTISSPCPVPAGCPPVPQPSGDSSTRRPRQSRRPNQQTPCQSLRRDHHGHPAHHHPGRPSQPHWPQPRLLAPRKPRLPLPPTQPDGSHPQARPAHHTRTRGLAAPGSYESAAQAPAGPENPANPQAVAVLVDGEKVSYLSL